MPNFNFAGEKGGLYCSQHKQDGMININHKRCMFLNCAKRPSFNFTGAAAAALPRTASCSPRLLADDDTVRYTCCCTS